MQDFIGASWETVLRVKKPVIAAVAGFALGGGCELAMMCDFILAADTARFGQPEINLGIFPGAGGTQRLTRAVGKSKAMDMILTARMMDAAEAERASLVSRVFPADQLLPEALKIAERLAALSPVALALAKQAVNRAFETDPGRGRASRACSSSCPCSAPRTRRKAWPPSWRSGSRRFGWGKALPRHRNNFDNLSTTAGHTSKLRQRQ